MAWDENVCANSPAPEFDIPEDTTAKDAILNILGYEEVTVTIDGKEMTILKKKEDKALVCSAKVCESTVGC